ncbi:MAG: thiamine-phosphate kinase [Sinobacteraceae bacterium]|nr:thiamine-phosphate kinase [Nevskiaceae bacterium]
MTKSTSDRPGEFELIAEFFAPLSTAPGAFGLTDDAALLSVPPGQELVITTDALLEGIHFFSTDPPDLVARKALRVNLSDLAAKGAQPVGYLLALSLPAHHGRAWLQGFVEGLALDQHEFAVSLMGGDTTRTSGPLTLVITAFGHVPQGAMLRRAGACPGDIVFVSGTIGDAGGGLACAKEQALVQGQQREYLLNRLQLPEPRIRLGLALRCVASASIDVSDGLVSDLGHIATASGVGIEIEGAQVPLSPELCSLWREPKHRLLRATTAGDDYEIAFTAPTGRQEEVVALGIQLGLQVTEIGRVIPGAGVALLNPNRRQIPVTQPGYAHF